MIKLDSVPEQEGCNNRFIFRSCDRFEDYNCGAKMDGGDENDY